MAKCVLDKKTYKTGVKVTDEDVTINIKPHKFHGEWHYTTRIHSRSATLPLTATG
jgi:hypothetical protein